MLLKFGNRSKDFSRIGFSAGSTITLLAAGLADTASAAAPSGADAAPEDAGDAAGTETAPAADGDGIHGAVAGAAAAAAVITSAATAGAAGVGTVAWFQTVGGLSGFAVRLPTLNVMTDLKREGVPGECVSCFIRSGSGDSGPESASSLSAI